MRWGRWSWLLGGLVGGSLAIGCAPLEADANTASLEASRRLVPSAVVFAAPEAGDGATRRVYAWEDADGTRTASGLPVGIDAQVHRGDVFLVTPDARLLRFAEGDPSRERRVASSVVDRIAVSPHALAYVVTDEDARGTASVLHRIENERDVVLDRSLYALGALTFAPDERTVIGIGSVNGGVAGLHVFDDDGRRCLTNCEHRTGHSSPQDWTPLPTSALRFEGDEVHWDDANGGAHVARWRSR